MNDVEVRAVANDPSIAASYAAKLAGTKITGNLRWYGQAQPTYVGATLADGREVRAYWEQGVWRAVVR